MPVNDGQQDPPPSDEAAFEPERPIGEECGVFGVWAPDEDVAKLTYYGLYALQHRGQEAAGMAVSDGSAVLVYKELGLVAQVFDEAILSSLRGHLAVGHTRYSTTGSGTWENAQPSFRSLSTGGSLALGHNGNLTNTAELARRVAELAPGADEMRATTDSDLITTLLAAQPDLSPDAAALQVLPLLQGAYCLVFMDEHTLYAARDPHGVRPLVLGRLERGWVVASETAALDIVGASFVREVEPGELLAIDEHGVRSSRFAEPNPKGCLFEYVYLARPDTTIAGQSVYTTRVQVGRTLAFEAPGRRRPGHPGAGVGHARRDRLRRAERHPVRHGAGEELLRRAHLHPAVADHPPARHPAQAQPAARGHPRQAPGRRRRLDRARQHPARPGADAARGRRGRGPRPDLQPAGDVAVLLRHRLRQPRRADRQRDGRRGDPQLDRRRLAGVRLARRADRAPAASRPSGCAGPASTATTRSRSRSPT